MQIRQLLLPTLALLGLGSESAAWDTTDPTLEALLSTEIALVQLGAQARDIVTSSLGIQEVAARTINAGRPMEMAALESDIHQLQIDLADLDKLLAQVERCWSTNPPEEPEATP